MSPTATQDTPKRGHLDKTIRDPLPSAQSCYLQPRESHARDLGSLCPGMRSSGTFRNLSQGPEWPRCQGQFHRNPGPESSREPGLCPCALISKAAGRNLVDGSGTCMSPSAPRARVTASPTVPILAERGRLLSSPSQSRTGTRVLRSLCGAVGGRGRGPGRRSKHWFLKELVGALPGRL